MTKGKANKHKWDVRIIYTITNLSEMLPENKQLSKYLKSKKEEKIQEDKENI